MLKHNFILFYRNLLRFRSTFLINLIGLSTGLACSLLIGLWVIDELRVDRFHTNADRIYQTMENHRVSTGVTTMPNTPGLLAESMAEDFPEIAYATPITPVEWFDEFVLHGEGEHQVKANGQFVGKDYFNIFSFNLLQGDKKEVLKDKNSIVISEELAVRLFKTKANALGRTLDYQLLHFRNPVTVTGVFEVTPANSSSQFDFILSFEAFKEINPSVLSWGNSNPHTVVMLEEGADVGHFNQKIENYLSTKQQGLEYRSLFITPFADRYLYGNYENGVRSGGRIGYVKLFGSIAGFILLIACINFMNLSTAKASQQVKVVGLKKAIGADRTTLIGQYLSESLIMAFVSLFVALLMVHLLLPQFNLISGKALALNMDGQIIWLFLGITILTGILAGSYPALYISGFDPMAVLKGRLSSSMGELIARKGLVVFQFALSVILIVAVWVVYQQVEFVQNKNLGFEKENIVTFPIEGKVAENPAAFMTELERIPGIMKATSMQHSLIGNSSSTVGFHWEGKKPDETVEFKNFTISNDYFETFGIPVIAGRGVSNLYPSDMDALVLNQTAVEIMGLADPIGAKVNLWGNDKTIVGVVGDFHFESMQEGIKPAFFKLEDNDMGMRVIAAKIAAGKERETLADMEAFYKSFNPGGEFNIKFLDAEYQTLYVAEERVSLLSRYFAGLAILISCLGLYGLAAFSADRRTKEIGIRKTLGASEWGIVAMLSGDFTKLVLMAIVLALPLSFYLVQEWLNQYAFKIELEWWYFIGAGLLTLLIALLTVSFQSIKAALLNPVESLRSE